MDGLLSGMVDSPLIRREPCRVAAMCRPVPMGVHALAGVATFTVGALATLDG